MMLPSSGVGVEPPWLVIAARLPIRIDLRVLDRIGVSDDGVLLTCGDLDISLVVADAERLVREAAPLLEGATHAPFVVIGDDAVRVRGDYLAIGKESFKIDEVREYSVAGANLPIAGGNLLQAGVAMLVVAAAERPRVEHWSARSGNGARAVVWLHGGPGLWDYLEPLATMLDPVCVSYRYDQRGCGRTQGRTAGTVAQHVADLEALRTAWGLDRMVLAGHSWGASLALHYALAHPDHVAGQILISSHELIPGGREAYKAERLARVGEIGQARLEALRRRTEADDSLAIERAWCEQQWAPDFVDPASARTLFVEALRVNTTVNREVTADARRLVAQPGFLDRLRALAIPTLMIHGEHDPRPGWAARELAALLPDATLLMLPSSGHCPWIEAPEAVRCGLLDFLGRLP